MNIAIVGAGFCGLATAWYYQQKNPDSKITIFDSHGIGGGASGMAAGLLHPFSGAHAKLNRWGWEGMESTLELLKIASHELGTPVYSQSGLLRIATTDMQVKDFQNCLKNHPYDTEWITKEFCQSLIPGICPFPALFIKKGIVVQCKLYLEGLWKACQRKGVYLEKIKISSLKTLDHFDRRFIATGAATTYITELASIPLKRIKGQLIELQWPSDIVPPKYPLNSHAYLTIDTKKQTCIAGATFEKDFSSEEPNLEIARSEILPKASAIFKELQYAPILGCQAGIRAMTPDRLPFVQEIALNTWVISGMGSRGLLYHALMAKRLIYTQSSCNEHI